MAVGLLLAVPGLHDVGAQILHMGIGWVLLAVALEILSCVGYVVIFLMVFEPRAASASARAWR